jgi:hypothetical protein
MLFGGIAFRSDFASFNISLEIQPVKNFQNMDYNNPCDLTISINRV